MLASIAGHSSILGFCLRVKNIFNSCSFETLDQIANLPGSLQPTREKKKGSTKSKANPEESKIMTMSKISFS